MIELKVCPSTLAEGFSTYSPTARNELFYGKGVSKNLGEAYRLYEQANTIEARQIIGEYYYYGCGIK